MIFRLKFGSVFWAPDVKPLVDNSQITRDTGIFAETVQDPTIQWSNRVSPPGRRYEYSFKLKLPYILSLEDFEDLVDGRIFEFKEGDTGDECVEITEYRNVTFADDGYIRSRKRVSKLNFTTLIILQDAG